MTKDSMDNEDLGRWAIPGVCTYKLGRPPGLTCMLNVFGSSFKAVEFLEYNFISLNRSNISSC